MAKGRRRQLGGVDRLPSGRWRVRVLDPGTGRRVSIGSFTTKAEAERAFAAAVTDQQKGAWVTPADGRIDLETYATRWLATRLTTRGEPLRPRVRELYRGYLDNHILPMLGSRALGQLNTAMIRRWHSELLAAGVGQSTTAKCYRLLRAILNSAVEDRHLVVNPCAIKGAGIENAKERSIPDIGQVFGLADAVSDRYRALVLLAAFGGLRRGELFGLRRADIDLLHRSLEIRSQRQESATGEQLFGPPKTAAGRRTLALPEEVIPALEEHLATWVAADPDALVFVGEKGDGVRAGVWQRDWDRARRTVGLPELRLHDLRHVAGTLAAATGAGTKEIMRRLGHATQDAALRYQHATDERDRVLASGIDRLIRSAREEPTAPVVPLRSANASGSGESAGVP
jgi:integrase